MIPVHARIGTRFAGSKLSAEGTAEISRCASATGTTHPTRSRVPKGRRNRLRMNHSGAPAGARTFVGFVNPVAHAHRLIFRRASGAFSGASGGPELARCDRQRIAPVVCIYVRHFGRLRLPRSQDAVLLTGIMRRWIIRLIIMTLLLGGMVAMWRYDRRDEILAAAIARTQVELQATVIPRFELQDATFEEALAYLESQARRAGLRRDIRFALMSEEDVRKEFRRRESKGAAANSPQFPEGSRVTVVLTNVPVSTAAHLRCFPRGLRESSRTRCSRVCAGSERWNDRAALHENLPGQTGNRA